jgi:hypothetical protein
MTDAKLKELPWLLSRAQVVRVFGLSDEMLTKLERAGKISRHCTSRKGKFFKTQLVAVLTPGGQIARDCPRLPAIGKPGVEG